MKFLLYSLTCLAVATADVSHLLGNGYNYPASEHTHEHHHEDADAIQPLPEQKYLPPAPIPAPVPAPVPVPAPIPEYLPPVTEGDSSIVEPDPAPAPTPSEPEPAHELANDGYHYRTVKKFRYRSRY